MMKEAATLDRGELQDGGRKGRVKKDRRQYTVEKRSEV